MTLIRRVDVPRLSAAIAICQAAGAIGGLATARSVRSWYPRQRKAALNPPSSVFGPVWTVLYLLMGISLYRAWVQARRAGRDDERVIMASFDLAAVRSMRHAWGLFRDRRPELYSSLLTLDGNVGER